MVISFCPTMLNSAIMHGFYHPGDDGGLAWNDPEIGIEWPQLTGTYPGNGACAGYTLTDGTPLNLNERDQNWPVLKDASQF